MSRERDQSDLREQLRAWDPLSEHRLSPQRSQRLQERLQEALDRSEVERRFSWWGGAATGSRRLAIAAGIVLVVAATLWWLQGDVAMESPQAPRPQIAVSPSAADLAASSAAEPARAIGPAPPTEMAAAQRPAATSEARPVLQEASTAQVAAAPATPPALATSDESRPVRRLQFSSPRGTRIYWTLDPQFDDSFATSAGE